jgi:hypothetical protein
LVLALVVVPVADNNKALSLDELAQNYGYAANFFNSDPELMGLIQQATAQQWSVAMFQAKFMASGWYRNHAASVRQWNELMARDPSTALRQLDQQITKITQEASQSGIPMDAGRAKQFAHDSLMFGWNAQEITAMLAFEFKYQPGQTTGLAATNADQIHKAANDYGLTVSDDTVGQWDQKMLRGDYTLDNIHSMLQNMAMTKYPGLNQYLSQGFTVRDVADPYIQSYSQILEQPSTMVQLTDPLIQKALQGTSVAPGGSKTSGGSTGTPSAPVQPTSLYDFENTLRQDPRWLNTKNANDSLQRTGMGILRDWGLYK